MDSLLDLAGNPIKCAACGRVFTNKAQYCWISIGYVFSENERICRTDSCREEYLQRSRVPGGGAP